MAATRSRMDEAATPASTSPERNSPALFRTSLIEPNAYVVPKRTVFSFTAAPRKKRCPEAARRGWRRPGRGWTGLPPRAWGCGGLREAGMCGGKRPQPGWAAPPEGGAPARRSPCGTGHSPPRKAAGPAPHGNGLRAYSQNPKPIGHTNGEGVPVPATKRGTEEPPGRPQREYSHRPTRGTAANPPSPPSQTSPPPVRGTGRPLAHIGGAALRTGTGPGAPEASAETQAPAARAGSGTPRASRKGNGATCRTASGFRPRPLP